MPDLNVTCPVCESENLLAETYDDVLTIDGCTVPVAGLERYRCQSCDADPVFEDQSRRNSQRVVDARRAARGLLTGREIVHVRERLGLTQAQAAEIFGGGANAFSKYERGEVMQSVAMDRLLKVCCALPDAFEFVQMTSDVNTNRVAARTTSWMKLDWIGTPDDAYSSRFLRGCSVSVSAIEYQAPAKAA